MKAPRLPTAAARTGALVLVALICLAAAPAPAPSPIAPPHREPSIIGDDNRVQVADTTVFPYSAVARIEVVDDSGELAEVCSGALIGPDAVLTAGHCLWNPETATWAKHVRVVPGKDGAREPFGAAFATDWWVPDGFISSGGDSDFDWGLIRLPDDHLGQRAHWFPVAVLDDQALSIGGFAPAIAGYPTDRPESTMWWAATSAFASIEPFALWYDIDTEAGESGAAIWSLNPSVPWYAQVVGIHTHGATGPSGLNSGSRIDQQLLDDLLAACRDLHCTIDVAPPPVAPPAPANRQPYGLVSPAIARD